MVRTLPPRLRFAGLSLLAVVLQLLLWFPWRPQVLKPGLDSSYLYAINGPLQTAPSSPASSIATVRTVD